MDSGLVTSERGHRRATVVATSVPPIRPADVQMNPSVLCRNCRVRLSLDDMESHECEPRDLKPATPTSSPRASTIALMTAASRASSFLDSFLDTPTLELPTTASQKTSETPTYPPPAKPVVTATSKEQNVPVRNVETVTHATQPRPSSPTTVYSVPQVATREESATPSYHYESLSHSPSSTPQSPTNSDLGASRDLPANHLARVGRSLSVAAPAPTVEQPMATVSSPLSQTTRPRGISSSEASNSLPVQCRVRGVRLNKDKVALYSIVSNLIDGQGSPPTSNSGSMALAKPNEIIVERRYREFHAFALAVYSMFPTQDLWQRLPPKTLCLPTNHHQSGGFLLRRKNGLDDFIRRALEMMELGSAAQGTIGQWYLVRKFLNLPATMATGGANTQQPTKDRSLVAATHELKKHARQTTGWTVVGKADEHDTIYEKVSDGFHTVKRVKTCAFPARAIFDMITKRTGGGVAPAPAPHETAAVDATVTTEAPVGPTATPNVHLDPTVESVEVLRRDNRQTWTERVVYKGRWTRPNMEMISIKTWKVEENGTIVIVMIPADDAQITQRTMSSSGVNRIDCILGGWVITPIPGEETCSVTWLLQANFGECDPQCEFTGSNGFTASFLARSFLLSWAEEINHLLHTLEAVYDPSHYRKLGPLLSGGDFHRLKLERRDTTSSSVMEDPRVYVLAHDLEPTVCLLVHKSTNTNALIFKAHHRHAADKQQPLELDMQSPLKAEWIMFEKPGNPRQDLSAIERNSTYSFATRHIGPSVFHFRLELLRRDCVLRNDPVHGFALFTTINGKTNILLKRVYLSYSATSSRLSFTAKLHEIHLFGQSEVEIMNMATPAGNK